MTKKYDDLFKDEDYKPEKKKKKTSSKDVPGTGMAKKTAKAIEKRQKRLDAI